MSRHLRLATRLARSGGCSVCSTHPSLRLSLKFLHFPLLLFSFYFSVQPWNIWNTYISNCSLRRNKGCRIPRRQAQTRAEAALLCNSEHARLQILIIAREGGGLLGDKPQNRCCSCIHGPDWFIASLITLHFRCKQRTLRKSASELSDFFDCLNQWFANWLADKWLIHWFTDWVIDWIINKWLVHLLVK